MKLCKDCKWSKYGYTDERGVHYRCSRPIGKTVSIEDGEERNRLHRWDWCNVQREDSWLNPFAWGWGLCMKHGRFWTPKEAA